MTATTAPISTRLDDRPLAAVGEEQHEHEDQRRVKNSTIHSGVGITPTAPWMRSLRAASRVDVWSSHLS